MGFCLSWCLALWGGCITMILLRQKKGRLANGIVVLVFFAAGCWLVCIGTLASVGWILFVFGFEGDLF